MVTRIQSILIGTLIAIASACEHEGGLETSSDAGTTVFDAEAED